MKATRRILSMLLLVTMLISVMVLSVSAETGDVLISTVENGCTASADNYDHQAQKPEKLIDGNKTSTRWISRSPNSPAAGNPGGEYTETPSAYLTWDKPQTVTSVSFYDGDESWAGGGVPDTWVTDMEIYFYDSTEEGAQPIKTVRVSDGVPSMGEKTVTLDAHLDGVVKFQVKILAISDLSNGNQSSGFTEIEVYGLLDETETPDPEPEDQYEIVDPANFRIVSNRGNESVQNLVNNSGMSDADGQLTVDAAHNSDWIKMWLTDFAEENANVAPWVMVDLGQAYKLHEMWVWNWNHSMTTRGLKNVKIEYATALTGDFSDYTYVESDWTALEVPEGMTFQAEGNPEYPFQFAKANGEDGQKATNLNDGKNSPVSFGDAAVRYVRITASPKQYNGNWGGAPNWNQNDYGMAELRFTADPNGSVKNAVLSPVGGKYETVQTVEMTCETEGASIYYTTDGTEPSSSNGTKYVSPVTVDRSMTLKAIAVKENFMDSRVVTAEYVLNVKAPAISFDDNTQTVTLSCETEGASIYYTTDGSTPTAESTLYTEPFQVEKTCNVKVVAVKDGWVSSKVVMEDYLNGEIYVATTGSDETGDGSQGKPFATIEKAKEYVRYVNGNMTKDITIHILPGEYFVTESIVFNHLDSGSDEHEIIYKAENGVDTVELIGGYRVNGQWTVVTGEETGADSLLPGEAAGKVYKTNVGTDYAFNTLYVNDRRATMARFPNLDHESKFVSAKAPYLRSAGGGLHELVFKANDLAPVIDALRTAYDEGYEKDLQVYMWDGGYWDWMTDTIPVASIKGNQLNFKRVEGRPEMYVPHFPTESNARYFIQGSLTLLDEPGEYYYNKTSGDLYYYPASGSMDGVDVIVPTMEKVLDVKGDSRLNPARNITFDSLQVKDTDTPEYYTYAWNQADIKGALGFAPPEAMQPGVTQPSYCEQTERVEFQVGTITLTNTENITITNCHVLNTGMFGVELYLANKNAEISNCLIEYTGHGGVHMDGGYPGVGGDENGDGYSRDNKVTNCIIHDIGETVGQASGVTIINSGYNTVSHCEIYNTPRRGVFVSGAVSRGSVPGNALYDRMKHLYTHNNTIEYVYMHNCQQDGGDDGALFVQNLFTKDAYKPNWFKQILVDTVASNPSMTDFTPNCINLDGEVSGLIFENLKSVNPQNFNMEVDSLVTRYQAQIEFHNTNATYGRILNQIDEFDDSKMEYDRIGVIEGFPEEYRQPEQPKTEHEDVYFEDNFEGAAVLDEEKWNVAGDQVKISTQFMSEGILNGKHSLELWNASRVSRQFEENLNKIVTVKMFDRQNDNCAAYSSGVKNSPNNTTIASISNETVTLGLGTQRGQLGYYVVEVNGQRTATTVARTAGWHEFTFDVTDGENAVLYIDGTKVGAYTMTGFNKLALGTEDGVGEAHYDEVVVYGGRNAESDAKDILSFTIPNQVGETVIAGNIITVTMPAGTDVTALVPEITVSEKAAVSPASGAAEDFTNPVSYTVTAENGTTKTYTVKVNLKWTDIGPSEDIVDKSELKDAIDKANGLDEKDYTDKSWDAVEKAREEANKVFDNADATQEEVNAAEKALEAAMDGLKEKEDNKPGWIIPGRPSKPSKPSFDDLPFNDVVKSDWFYDEVAYVYGNGLMNGVRDGEFEPETSITRGMIVTILYRLEGEPMNNYVGLFSDVENNEWYTDAVEWAAKNDIVNGYTTGDFGPMDPVTREQLAAILYRYADYCGYDVDASTSLKPFNDDETISNYAVDAMEWAVANNLLNGSHNNLAPKANATRAQAAAILMRFCEEAAK